MYTNNYSNSVSTNSLYKVYSWMMVGLGITAITSALLYASGIFMLIIQIPMISLLLFIVQISLTISMGRQLSRNTPASKMKTMFIVYSHHWLMYIVLDRLQQPLALALSTLHV